MECLFWVIQISKNWSPWMARSKNWSPTSSIRCRSDFVACCDFLSNHHLKSEGNWIVDSVKIRVKSVGVMKNQEDPNWKVEAPRHETSQIETLKHPYWEIEAPDWEVWSQWPESWSLRLRILKSRIGKLKPQSEKLKPQSEKLKPSPESWSRAQKLKLRI